MSWQLVSFLILAARPARRLRLVRALAPARAGRRPRRRAGRAGDRRADRLRRLPQRQADHRHRHLRRLRARPGGGLRGRRASRRWSPTSGSGRARGRPWQMAAWGLCGILGAALALGTRNVGRLDARRGLRPRRGRLRRDPQLLADGDLRRRQLSWERFWILEGRAIPFEVAHATGNVVLALVAGPGDDPHADPLPRTLRMEARGGRRRSRRRPGRLGPTASPSPRASLPTGGIAALLVAVLLLGAFASARAEAAAAARPRSRGRLARSGPERRRRLRRKAAAPTRAQEMTGWAMLGLEAAGVNPQDVTSGGQVAGRLPAGRDRRQSRAPATSPARSSPSRAPGSNRANSAVATWSRRCSAKRRKDGSYDDWPNSTAYAVLALRSAGIANVADSLEWLREVQNEDGGWGDVAGLAERRRRDRRGAAGAVAVVEGRRSAAVGYLRQAQQPGGGWRLGGNGALNTQSTAWAVQGLLAAGANPADFKRGGKSAYEYLEEQPGGRRPLPLLVEERPDAGLGDRPGAGRGGEAAPAAGGGAAGAAAEPVTPDAVGDADPDAGTRPCRCRCPKRRGDAAAEPDRRIPRRNCRKPDPRARRPSTAAAAGRGSGTAAGGVGATPGGSRARCRRGSAAARRCRSKQAPANRSRPAYPSTNPTGSGSDGSVLGSIIAGLIVGGLLFAIGYGPYRRWQATRPRARRRQAADRAVRTPRRRRRSADERWPVTLGSRPPPAPPAINGTTPHAGVRQPRPPPRRSPGDEYPRPMDGAWQGQPRST